MLDVTLPVLAAPMAAGPTTPALVRAAGDAGSLGFVPGGYKSAAAMADDIAAVRDARTFGVNLFAPHPVAVDPAAFRAYAERIDADARRYGLSTLDAVPRDDDDAWADKIDLLLAEPVPVVSLTFGVAPAETVRALRRAGTVVLQTVTSVAEAREAVDTGVDGLIVQASAAGAHSGTFTPEVMPAEVALIDLLAAVRATVDLPLVAAGGLGRAADVAATRSAGAMAAMVGTMLLRTDESGASGPYRAALAEATRPTTVTRAFTGRPARALSNEFLRAHDAAAPVGYPSLHYLTSPLRKAAAAAGDPERLNLWAGTAYRSATDGPAADVLRGLAADW